MFQSNHSNNTRLISLIMGPGQTLLILGILLVIVPLLFLSFGSDELKVFLTEWKVVSYPVVPYIFKLGTYILILGLAINFIVPKLTKIMENDIGKAIQNTLIPKLEEINNSVSSDLRALKEQSISQILKTADAGVRKKFLQDVIRSLHGDQIAHSNGFFNCCIRMAETDAQTPYFKKDNDKDITIRDIGSQELMKWDELNKYTIQRLSTDPNNPAVFKVPWGSSFLLTGSIHEGIDLVNEHFSLKIQVKGDSQKNYVTLLEAKNFLSLKDGCVKSLINEINVEIQSVGGKNKIIMSLEKAFVLKDQMTKLYVEEISLVDIEDNMYFLRTKQPFRGCEIKLTVPDSYRISEYKLCDSSNWDDIQLRNDPRIEDALHGITSSTHDWVMKGLYFVAKWEQI